MQVHEQPSHTFQVDLRGLVDLLSHHLYSSPRVYVRELLQNAVDAVTARQNKRQDGTPGEIRLTVLPGALRVDDPGIGLSEADVHRFLATIGSSSKRDDLAGVEVARREFLGQFGIGLLACFVVADEITVVSRSATDPAAVPVEWRATSDGAYTVRTLPDDARPEAGTTVTVTARRGAEQWFTAECVRDLAGSFGALLRYDILVEAQGVTTKVNTTPPVWDRDHATPDTRRAALLAYGQETLGFAALDVVDLDLPLVGVRGAAYVLPVASNPLERGGHRVYLKGMLLSESASKLLPEWAFFARCIVDAEALRPTASREALYDDETLAAVRDALGDRIRDWLTGLAATDPERLERFLAVHQLGVKALAVHDDELLRTMLPWLRFETTAGRVSLAELARRHPMVHLARTVEEFRQVAAIASAQGLGVVNGGYTYDAALVDKLPSVAPGTSVVPLAADAVVAHLDAVPADRELAVAAFLAAARARLDRLDCDVVLRTFHPVSVPALYLDSREALHERSRAQAEADADPLWTEILSNLRATAPRAQLVLNDLNPVVRRVTGLADPELRATAVDALYGQALLMTHRPLRTTESALLNRALGDLLTWAADRTRTTEA
ncbi:molecular chaperone HtpG [Virgisporangium aurantiacum]|uniref:Molecular chaperone HtpG n=1 Tax=Virgisporangium aurantiacum TaxID=175570 RepID=A0A8J4DYK4_9ACTN|nr:molecular chaperone HtpG [Virgisporangium aurantiacum]